MNSIDQLCQALPPWVVIEKKRSNKLVIKAHLRKPSGAPSRTYTLVVRLTAENVVVVLEDKTDPCLPECCVERHINPDSTFCLYFGSTRLIANSEAAKRWWSSLADFLNHQDYATKWRKWPVGAQLSHGDAAQVQLEMEELAIQHGWRDEVLLSIFRKQGWLAGNLPRQIKGTTRLANLRSPCPRGCRHKHHALRRSACEHQSCVEGCRRQHKPIVRKSCPHRTDVEELVRLEHLRRLKETEVIEALRKKGFQCCGTMDNCPFS